MTVPMGGLHHVTAITADPQGNLDWHEGLLGRRLVKRTVNFDAPDAYHLYYGDRTGSPGGVLTFFGFTEAGPGRPGSGAASAVAYAVPAGGLDAWIDRLAARAIDFEGPEMRFGERLIALRDPDGLCVELIETCDPAPDPDATKDPAPLAGFHSVTLALEQVEPTGRLLTELFGWLPASVDGAAPDRMRYRSPTGDLGGVIDLVPDRGAARLGAGSIHHIAFRAADPSEQRLWRERVKAHGLDVTPVIDRQYFEAIYFREPGGVLFEIATDLPGFAVDEPVETLGEALKLPARYEPHRGDIERRLPPLRLRR